MTHLAGDLKKIFTGIYFIPIESLRNVDHEGTKSFKILRVDNEFLKFW